MFEGLYFRSGSEFLVNTEATSSQYDPTITGLANGGFVVSWTTQDSTQDGSSSAIKAQVFDATGAKVGSEFLANTEATSTQNEPTITGLSNGGFVVSWTTNDSTQDGSSIAIKAQVFDATGAKVGSEFLVNTEATGFQYEPTITGLSNGGFVVSWRTDDSTQDGSSTAIKAQVFDATGAKVGSEFLVNTEATNNQYHPTITGLSDGGFVVSWRTDDSTQDGSNSAVKAQVFDATGAKVGSEFLVNTEATDNQYEPRITGLFNGGFVVSWTTDDSTQDGSSNAIKAQVFDAAGAKVGSEFLVNTEATNFQNEPTITGLSDGGFVVSWTTRDNTQDGSGYAIKAQVFDATGGKVGSEFLVNTEAFDFQFDPTITGLSEGGFVVSWTTNDSMQDGSSTAIKAQVFNPVGATLPPPTLTNVTVSETDVSGTVVAIISSPIVNNGTVTYTLADDPSGAFEQVGNQLILRDSRLLDGQTDPMVDLTFTASLDGVEADVVVPLTITNAPLASTLFDAGDEFLVNTVTAGSQIRPDITGLSGGGFVATWETGDSTQDGSGSAIKAQVFDAAGTKIGNEFMVNTEATGQQIQPTITVLVNGGFVVSWTTLDIIQDGNGWAIKAQVFDAAGGMVSGELLVNTEATDNQREPAITGLSNGGFVVSWTTGDGTQDGSGDAIKAQVFNAAGAKVGGELLVNTEATSNQLEPVIASLSNGGFAISWTTRNDFQDGSSEAIKAQIFDATGAKVGNEFLVNTEATSRQDEPTITGLSNGGFVISWTTLDGMQDGSRDAIKAQMFDSSGAKVGSEFLANTKGANLQDRPTVTGLSNGGFVISWSTLDNTQDGSSWAIKAQIFDTAGETVGSEFLVNTEMNDVQVESTITKLSNGGFVIGWRTQDITQDGSSSAIKARIFDPQPVLIQLNAASDTGAFDDDGITSDTAPTLNLFGLTIADLEIDWDDGNGFVAVGPVTDNTMSFTLGNAYTTDGAKNIQVRLTDGNAVATTYSYDIDVDTSADLSAIDLIAGSDAGSSTTDDLTSDDTPTISYTAENGAAVEINWGDGNGFVAAANGTGAGQEATLGSAYTTDGTKTVQVRVTDTAGNTTTNSIDVTVDTTDPTLSAVDLVAGSDSGTSSTDDITSDDTPTISYTAENGAAVEINWGDGNGFVAAANGTGAGQEATLGSAYTTDGTKTVQVRVTDTAGNTTTNSIDVTVDTTDPTLSAVDLVAGSDSGTSSTDDITSDDTPTISYTAENGAAVAIDWGDGNGFVAAANGTGAGQEATLGSAYTTDGTKTVQVRVTDTAGNTTTNSIDVTVDTTDPTLSAVDLVAGSDSGTSSTDDITSDDTPTISYTAENGAAVAIDWGDGNGFVAAAAGTGAGQEATLGSAYTTDGTKTVQVRVTDTAGNTTTNSIDVTVDTTDPTLSAVDLVAGSDSGTSSTDDITSDDTPTISYTAENGAAVAIDWGDGNGFVAAAAGTGAGQEATLGSAYTTDGTKTVQVRVTDTAGNTTTNSIDVTVDTTDPTLSAVDLVAGSDSGTSSTDDITSDDTPTISYTAENGAAVAIDWGDGNGFVAAANGTGAGQEATLGSAYTTDGTKTVQVRVTDTAGNTTTNSIDVTVDTTDPTLSAVDLVAGSDSGTSSTDDITSDDTPTISYTAENGAAVAIDWDDGNGFVAAANGTGAGQEATLGSAYTTDGTKTVQVRVTDTAGNTTTNSIDVTVDTTNPTLTLSNQTITENAPNQSIVGTVGVVDASGFEVTLSNDAGGRFELDGLTLRVAEDAVLDFEANDHIAVTLNVEDAAGNSTEQAFSITLTDLDEQFVGDNGDNTIDGDSGDNLITAGEGSDTIDGGVGNDVIDTGAGGDTASGGEGDDQIVNPNGNDIINGDAGNDEVVSFSGNTTINGGGDDDFLRGGVQDDQLIGEGGSDVLIGDISDFLFGQDRLDGGAGDDLLEGGKGADTFVFRPQEGDDVIATFDLDYANPLNSTEVASDFVSGVDKINLVGFGYNDAAEAFGFVSDVDDVAVFSDQETTIEFFGLLKENLTADDFFIF